MKSILTLMFAVLLAGPLYGEVKLDSPNSFARDSRIRLDIGGLEGQEYRTKWWIRSNDGRDAPDHDVFNSGATCAVWAGPGHYEALITVAVIDGTDITWYDIEHEFKVIGDGPLPPPDDDDPIIPPPNDQYDFGDVAGEVVRLCKPVKDDSKAEAAALIANSYRKHGLLAVKGDFDDQNDLADATSADFVAELGLNRYLRWRPVMTRIRQHMQGLMNDDKLESGDMPAWGALWEEYAKGFDAVALQGVRR